MNLHPDDINVVIILYNPTNSDIDNVREISKRYKGVVCDNSTNPVFDCAFVNKMKYISNGGNIGIAAAQNKAIKSLDGFKYLVFLDQDSRLEYNYPEMIVEEFIRIKEKFPKLAILGPSLINGRKGDGEYKSEIYKDKYLSDSFIFRQNIIASGACIPNYVLSDVGLNEERLFIDLVDSEWCWRANSKGYICGITTNLTISHTIGKRIIKIWKIKDIKSSPFRYYYQTRNYLLMLPRDYVPFRWKRNIGIKYILRFFYLPFIDDDGFECWKYMMKGIGDYFKKH